jgi:hypothetical protein
VAYGTEGSSTAVDVMAAMALTAAELTDGAAVEMGNVTLPSIAAAAMLRVSVA